MKRVINRYITTDIKVDSTLKEFSIISILKDPFAEIQPHSFIIDEEDLEDDEILEFEITIKPVIKKKDIK